MWHLIAKVVHPPPLNIKEGHHLGIARHLSSEGSYTLIDRIGSVYKTKFVTVIHTKDISTKECRKCTNEN